MTAYRRQLYSISENLNRDDFIFAKYIVGSETGDYMMLAAEIGVEQTTGTWEKVPGETDELVERHGAKVVSAFEIPDYTFTKSDGMRYFFMEVAYPIINYTHQIPMMLTSVLGNISMMGNLKLMDLEFPKSWVDQFPGPKFGPEGVRKLLNVHGRPLTNNMIKPCLGLSPEKTADLFYEVAVGGIDIIKDDELIANAPYSLIKDRVKACMAAEKRAFEETGERTMYVVNVTDSPSKMLDNAKAAIEGGATCLLVNHLTAGMGMLQELAENPEINVPLMSHPNFVGAMSWSELSGMSAHLTLGKLPRLCGADIAVYPTAHGKIPHNMESYMKVSLSLQEPMADIKASMPLAGGGVHPGMTKVLMDELGNEQVLGCGAGVHAHPMGPRAGAMAMRQSIDAVLAGKDLREAGKEYKELQSAIDRWGVSGEKEIFGLRK